MMAGSSDEVTTLPTRVPEASSRYPANGPLLCVLPGTPESASSARQLARQLLGDTHPATETVMLLVSELVTNAIMHSKSGAPGGTVTVALCPGSAGVLIQVRDDGGSSEPRVSGKHTIGAEHGFGLQLVDALADTWATISCPEGRVTWCRVSGRPPSAGSNEKAVKPGLVGPAGLAGRPETKV